MSEHECTHNHPGLEMVLVGLRVALDGLEEMAHPDLDGGGGCDLPPDEAAHWTWLLRESVSILESGAYPWPHCRQQLVKDVARLVRAHAAEYDADAEWQALREEFLAAGWPSPSAVVEAVPS
jgi:hypothetical protein